MPSTIVVAMGVAAATYSFLLALLRLTQDANEPPSVCDSIPFVSPIIQMAARGVKFHKSIRDQYKHSIYTLRMPGARLYVVNDTSLIAPIQSQPKTLSFAAVEARIAANLIGVNDATNKIIGSNLMSDDGYLLQYPKYVHSSLAAGPGLDAMNRKAMQVFTESLAKWTAQGDTPIKLFEWVRHELFVASSESVYGPKNPFRDPSLEGAWQTLEQGMLMLLMGLPPKIFAKGALAARESLVKAWEEYFESGAYEDSSMLVQARVKINKDFGIPMKETARIELGGNQALLSNTVPGAFWMVYHIYSNPAVLEDIREEVSKGVREEGGVCTIDLSFVTESCPILLSTFKEMMRMESTTVSARVVMEDCMLAGKYLLKKGSNLLIPASVHHTNQPTWGDSVGDFNHRRFLREPGVKRVSPVAFRGFGGGSTLCPGRHFAVSEILMLSALLVLRFDIVPMDGTWTRPPTAKSPIVPAFPTPDDDIRAELRPRDNRAWKVTFAKREKGMGIVAEDDEPASSGH
ncbi:cytochrome P450 [Stachybotrys elegans]|uniref:Cytochrome P450 n=1 Tax=Stachybotrys elegans TaxID=80388 RepID=A0A8K0WJK9_9HYPO|nr:cytochrome P450 [Stachybotrys elegans]